jgi:hypothetical protein
MIVPLLLLAAATSVTAQTPAVPQTSCTGCHGNAEWFPETAADLMQAHGASIHASAGISCHDCHGGNPDPALADDLAAAMDEEYANNPYKPPPERGDIPAFCGRCHSDPAYMRAFRPSGRIDQVAEYWTSQHGQALRNGDENVATCVDCHDTHGMLAATNPESAVYPTRVAETCGRCHADADRMAGYTRFDGLPLPVDQEARWRRSVHAEAMLEKGDLSAPVCNDCHGNHGAAPPGLESVVFVCGQCHGREATLFRNSAKHEGFASHTELFLEGGTDCTTCHEEPDPPSRLAGLTHLSECATCHGNHSVVRPTVAMLAPLPMTPCAFCHENRAVEGVQVEEASRIGEHYRETRNALLEAAEASGLEGDDLFDSLLDLAVNLPMHTEKGSGEAGQPVRLRAEFERLLQKFRLGKIHYSFRDPVTGKDVTEKVVRCSDCHAIGDETVPGTPAALATTYVTRMSELTALTATADRQLLAARRGGVEVRDGLLHLDGAVAAQIDLEVLVHGFSAEEDGEFVTRQKEGVEHARMALEAAAEARSELSVRRTWLAVLLAFIVLVLAGLVLKIRELSKREQAAAARQA